MAFTLGGTGTHYQGERWLPDGTHITTKWLVFFYVPIIPLGSVRVLDVSAAILGQELSVEDVPLDMGMVSRVYAWIIGAIVLLAALRYFAPYVL